MQLNALRYFAMVAASGSFAGTARHFQVPASSVSRHIAALEKDVGLQLLYRHTRAVRLTEAGERYYAQVREALDILDMAAEDAADKDALPKGLIRINAPIALGRLHIAPILHQLQRDFPSLSIQLTLTDAFVDPVQEGAEITVRIGRLQDSSLVGRRVSAQHYLTCASQAYLDQHGVPEQPDDLFAHNCLAYRGRYGAQRWFFRQPGEASFKAYEVGGSFHSNNAEALVAAAHAGLGIVLFPTWLFDAKSFRRGGLVKLLQPWEGSVDAEPPEIHILSPANRARSKKLRLVSDYLIERIGTPPYWDKV